ncbi:MAG: sugar phosphate isomerase/epimerase [Nakamurella sp.]
MTISVAGAPVSFGVFEMTPEGAETVAPDDMLSILSDIGYEGVDLGPVGYFGEGAQLRERLQRHGLELAGGWVQLPMTDDDAFKAALPELHRALTVFRDATTSAPHRMPLPTLADSGSSARSAAPGRGQHVDPLTEAAFERLVANASRAADIVRDSGFEPTFHHHAGTYVESPEEIDRFLSATDIGLTLDVGHLAIAGGDPLALVQRWGTRINHLHLKDVATATLQRTIDAGGGMPEVWSSGAFTALGQGDLDLAPVLDAVIHNGFNGWIVVEQDVLNGPDISIDTFQSERAADQRANRELLRAWI